jgi:hypothetical protein
MKETDPEYGLALCMVLAQARKHGSEEEIALFMKILREHTPFFAMEEEQP